VRRTILATFVLILSGTLASTAAAGSSRVAHDRYSVEQTRVDNTLCPFPVNQHATADLDDALFFDEDGNLVRLLETVQHVRIDYTANGHTLTAIGTGGIDLHFNVDGSVSASTFGINLLLTLPGEGAIFLDVGHAEYLFDPHIHLLFQAGPASYDLDAFCAALSA